MKHAILFPELEHFYKQGKNIHFIYLLHPPFFWASKPELALQAMAAVNESGFRSKVSPNFSEADFLRGILNQVSPD